VGFANFGTQCNSSSSSSNSTGDGCLSLLYMSAFVSCRSSWSICSSKNILTSNFACKQLVAIRVGKYSDIFENITIFLIFLIFIH